MRTATPRNRQSRAAAFVLSALLAATTLTSAACSGSSAPAKTAHLEQTTLTIGVVKGEIGALPIYIGYDEQLFTKAGITIKVDDSFTSEEQAMGALGKSVDVVYGDYARYFLAQALGQARLSLVAEGYLAGAGGVNLVTTQTKSNNSLTIKDVQAMLARKHVLVPTAGSSEPDENFTVPELMLASTMKAMAADTRLDKATAEAELVPTPQDQMSGQLSSGTAEGAVMTEPAWSMAAVANPLTVALDLTQGADQDMPMGGYFAEQDFTLTHPNLVAAFNTALNSAKQDAASRTTAILALTQHYKGVGPAVVTGISLGTFPTTVNVARLKRVVTAMQSLGLAWSFDPSVMVPSNAVGVASK